MPHIVLASKSPRRHELLRRMGITDFSVVVPDVEETYPEGDRKSTRLNSSHSH